MTRPWIAFVGAHCTGKSTLLAHVRECSAARVYAIREVARGVIRRGYPMGKDAHAESYLHYVRDQLVAERSFEEARYDVLISDRTVLDTLSYARVNRRLPRPSIPDVLLDLLREVWLQEAKLYKHVFFPIEFGLVGDGVRDEDEDYRREVSDEMLQLLEEHAVPYSTVSGAIESRYAQLAESWPELRGRQTAP